MLDNFDLGAADAGKSGAGGESGIYLIRSQIEDILKKRGLEKVSIKPGDEFDPMIAEAMTEVAVGQAAGTIVEEDRAGISAWETKFYGRRE